ncbi:MAG TPA: SAM-dependent methyltransferase [Edaphocola sp.]|nr:SAM-dependent methyltransferase [Edaphocola sp.]
MSVNWKSFEQIIIEKLDNNSFIKITLSTYKGAEELKNVYVKKVIIKGISKLSFTYRYQKRDVVKNYDFREAMGILQNLLDRNQFRIATLFSLENDIELSIKPNGIFQMKTRKASLTALPDTDHDITKQRKIQQKNQHYLHALKITDSNGEVLKNAQDKFKQINHYIEILSSLLDDLPVKDNLFVADMGSGKGYLTFALYDYLVNQLNRKAEITGVEFRKDLVDLCNQIAKNSDFEQLHFIEGSIENYQPAALDILIALHACDTATDDAIIKGILNNATLIVTAPCCHKQIRKSMEKGKPSEDLDFMLKYGLFMERQAEMLTDAIRLLVLEYYGYQTKVVDFVSDKHTPKNVMLIAQKKKGIQSKEAFLEKYNQLKAYYGFDFHHLVKSLEIEKD